MGKTKKRIMLLARDPGGANVIASIYNYLKDNESYEVLIFGKDYALDKYKQFDISGQDIEDYCRTTDYSNLKAFIERIAPHLIITGTSGDDFTEKYIWNLGKELKIDTVAVLDQWVNYGVRFSRYSLSEIDLYRKCPTHDYLPSNIWVMDEYAKSQMVSEGIDGNIIRITGQPYFNHIISEYNKINNDINRHQENVQILFVSEPISEMYADKENGYSALGYNEITVLECLLDNIKQIRNRAKRNIDVVIRYHPKENNRKYDHIIEKNNGLNGIKILVDSNRNGLKSIASSDLVVGMASIFLLEAKMVGKPMMSIQKGLIAKNPFLLENIGVQSSLYSNEDIQTELIRLFECDFTCIKEWSLDLNSLEHIEREVKRLCQF